MPPKPKTASDRGQVRIISGKFRGRRLPYALDPGLRPMKDRVREALFNLVSGDIEGRHALDLFAGTGALGLETLSRGAARATFWERDRRAAEALRRTIADWELRPSAIVITHDTLDWFRQEVPLRPDAGWLVFCSPPYELYETHLESLLDTLATIVGLAPPELTLVVESDDRFNVQRLPAALEWDVRRYAPAVVAVGRRVSQG